MFETVDSKHRIAAGKYVVGAFRPVATNRNSRDVTEIITAAALALEQGTKDAGQLKAENLLDGVSAEGRIFRRATARYLSEVESQSKIRASNAPDKILYVQPDVEVTGTTRLDTEQGIAMIVTDTSLQIIATRVTDAITRGDDTDLSPGEKALYAEYGVTDGARETIAHLAEGKYEQLNEEEQLVYDAVLFDPSFSPEMKEAITDQASAIEKVRAMEAAGIKQLAALEHAEPGRDHFREISEESWDKAQRFYAGNALPNEFPPLQKEVLEAFVEFRSPRTDAGELIIQKCDLLAAARFLDDAKGTYCEPAVALPMMLTDVNLQLEASDEFHNPKRGGPADWDDNEQIMRGNFHLVSEPAEARMAHEMFTGGGASALEKLRIAATYPEPQSVLNRQVEIERPRTADQHAMAAAAAAAQMSMGG
ncbi:hypothetical protein [Croceicoccus gelatinilyticus]|uniref:hypothetical protein n=1 Tax=Croceicoccus gelatinilyticus TaxID=2835536 RepID=UPI001BCF9420|nr:hypothetical protein [Croceicoccus gelatinilyticus]MBS7671518.1 hypothetical protein [Croceicoccus gelatinilyticus]